MFTNHELVYRIETELERRPFCTQCGQPNTVTEHDGALWLECSALGEHRGGLRALLSFDLASFHTRRRILELAAA